MSKADKLRRLRIRQQSRPGPKPKEGDRYPSGDLRPYETERETMAVVMAQRAKLGYDLEQQKDERAGYTLGRMLLDGKITSAEFEGGQWFIEHMERYYRATGIPSPNPRAQDLTRVQIKGHDGELSESQQDRVRIFDRGVRLDSGKPGTGLGLAIVRDVAEIYGGSIALEESEDLGGLLVRLRLPAG